ncbi:GPN-loop GTPase 1 [Cichlidogyrus casuarinus]|uniref:GPN-loop GTPase n=1 Tax=Cichlidogyrus casuarinus TaxID=1844966 RepID=A0ABD2PLK7_9PLAT
MSDQTDCVPTNIIVLGMAGAGKTTFVKKLLEQLSERNTKTFSVNLDPAVHHVPYSCNVDIRDTVKFKEVMKQYGFGPNGAIMTSLNFFTSKFHELITILTKNKNEYKNIVFDTPGQIEIFTWSASGIIITEALSNTFPTIIIYVIDTARCHNPTTFMSNMLYACSITYRMRLPILCVFNKTDVVECDFALEWMRDFEKFQESLAAQRGFIPGVPEVDDVVPHEGSPYLTSLTNSMSLVLDEFYSEIKACGVSSLTGDGFGELLEKILECRTDFVDNFLPQKQQQGESSKSTLLDLAHSSDEEITELPSEKILKPFKNDGSQTLKEYVASQLSNKKPKVKRKDTGMLVDLGGSHDASEMDIITSVDGEEVRPHENIEDEESDLTHTICTKLKLAPVIEDKLE